MVAVECADSSDLDSDEDAVVLYGPKPLPGNGRGTITAQHRKIIMDNTNCSAAVRKREGWATKMLTVSGPLKGLTKAKTMAEGFILQIQAEGFGNEWADTPDAEDDPESTMRMEQKADGKKARRKRKKRNRQRREEEEAQKHRLNPMQMQPMMHHMMNPMPAMSSTQMPFPMMPSMPMMQPGMQIPMWQMQPWQMPMWQGATQIKTETGVAAVKQEIGATPVKKETGATPVKREMKTESGAPPKKQPKRTLPQPLVKPKMQLKPKCKGKAFRPVQDEDEGGDEVMVEALPDPIQVTIDSDDEDADDGDDEDIAQVPMSRISPPWRRRDVEEARLQNVKVYAVGWQQQGCKHSKDMDGYAKQLEDRFHIRYRHLLPIAYYVNCHKFRGEASGHVGLYDADVASFVNHWHFRPWLREVKRMFESFENHLADEEDTIKLVMVCKAGRNRSVSAKVVLNYLFGMLGYDTNDDEGFLSRNSWTRAHNVCCHECDRCKDMTDMKVRSCQYAVRMWGSL